MRHAHSLRVVEDAAWARWRAGARRSRPKTPAVCATCGLAFWPRRFRYSDADRHEAALWRLDAGERWARRRWRSKG